MQEKYTPKPIEQQAQKYWDDNDSFVANVDTEKDKYYCHGACTQLFHW
jgi:leucyl-tRNA synthetase